MRIPQLTPATLAGLLNGIRPPVVIDVRLDDDFRCCKIPGALNNCVFEVAFTERMPAVAPDLSAPVCLYGAGDGSMESRMAAEKLLRLGYTSVQELSGGIAGWRDASMPVEESPAAPAPVLFDGRYRIDLAESRIQWTGRNLLNHHTGRIGLKSGEIIIEDGRLAGGSFVIAMTDITCHDLAGNTLHDVLIRHLCDHDFFDTGLYPEARFEITGSEPMEGAGAGAPNLHVHGQLTLKDTTAPLDFLASAGVTPDGKAAAQATLAFDRTLWKVLYGSGKWFHHLGGHLVNDMIELQLRIVAE
ncbi:YceI family protein [Luteolibacter flavescens]|uniref:YceI family protein n=1 Tax=Luteolibacter flavescens TaxID=1859460 RepID=A0ABT3FTD2_9BACT|nr:YceI family protein [Luteolibacter flavescens]MCW1886506.1 YceI family protein [Luteolibacter flavescens]